MHTRLTISSDHMITVSIDRGQPVHEPDPYDLDRTWRFMRDVLAIPEEVLIVVTKINGYRLDVLEDVLSTYTEARSFDQLTWEVLAEYNNPFEN